jgi:hypothetical protein
MRRYFARLIDMLWPPGARMTGGHGNEAGFEVSAPMLRDWRNVADFLALAEGLVPSAGKLVQLRHATHQAEVHELRGHRNVSLREVNKLASGWLAIRSA